MKRFTIVNFFHLWTFFKMRQCFQQNWRAFSHKPFFVCRLISTKQFTIVVFFLWQFFVVLLHKRTEFLNRFVNRFRIALCIKNQNTLNVHKWCVVASSSASQMPSQWPTDTLMLQFWGKLVCNPTGSATQHGQPLTDLDPCTPYSQQWGECSWHCMAGLNHQCSKRRFIWPNLKGQNFAPWLCCWSITHSRSCSPIQLRTTHGHTS